MNHPGGGPPPGGPPWPHHPHWQQAPQKEWPPQARPQQQWPPPTPPAGSGSGSLGISLRRAFRLRIDPSEVTSGERDTLMSAGITSPTVQAFLAWRRSVLLIAAIGILPILGFRVYDVTDQEGNPPVLNGLISAQLIVDVVFGILLWSQIGRWTNWRSQRRVLNAGWILFFLMPFVLWLYPLRDTLVDALRAGAEASGDPTQAQIAAVAAPLVGMTVALFAMIQLAPKAVSLLPGILRASITSKLLFPGASGPGWLIMLLAPIYGIIMYVVLIVPYQLTGSGFFVAAMIGLIGGQLWLGRMGYKLARPERLDEALALVSRVRIGYFVLNLAGIVFVAIGLADLFKQFDLPVWGMVQILVSLLVNILLFTLIATDLIVANLARGQVLLAEPGVGQALATFQRDVAQFADPVVSSQRPR